MIKLRFLYVWMLSTCCMSALAQTSRLNYQPFSQEGKTWESQVGLIMENTYSNHIEGDTVINGENWKKVYNSMYQKAPWGLENSYFAAIRDVGKKVYAIAKGSSRARLLYDFGLQEGDVVQCGIEGNVFGCLLEPGEKSDTLLGFPFKTYLKVERIDTIKARDLEHRRFTLSLLDAFREYIRSDAEAIIGSVIWIEGIGSGAGPFSPWMPLPPRQQIILHCNIGQTCIFGYSDFHEGVGLNTIYKTQPSNSPESIYDLQGRKLPKAPQKGIFIQDGKKIVK